MRGGEAHAGYLRWWDAYFGLVAVAVAAATLLVDDHRPWRRGLAVGAIAAMAVLHVTAGRKQIRRGAEDGAALTVTLTHLLLYVVAVVSAPFTSWLLFAVVPLIFQLMNVRTGIVLVILANLVIPAVALVEEPQTATANLLIAVITGAASIWVSYWTMRVIRQNVERGQLIDELEASRAEVARLSHDAGISAERARLAGEIHDTLAQGFTSVVTLLQAYDPQLRDERLALAVRTAKENLAEARALVAALAPAALASTSLSDAVRRQADRFTEEAGMPATVRVTGTPRELPTPVEVVLLRAAQEALTNVRRHAHATETEVVLTYDEQRVRLVVHDDGRGLASDHTDGFGLAGMRSRAEQVRGSLTVRGGQPGGTTVELEVPA
ncbi:sensor histidine kinase [Micromonospora siamensis]|uniref:Signal transduction histidine kinase n=1 Tax=Micromonospora siamensis TaxID=299152 RepID=A0A1C5I6G9_9ACTN|nr:ATP-binding protein [Micromonospora siamensis]SCG53763.1 Signal transduction histidine kinase [Micromonospora siamensis]